MPQPATHLALPPRPGPDADLPALLLPLRVETRFAGTTAKPELWVRVYPDQIAIDTHDARVTGAEIVSTHQYWEAMWRAGTGHVEAERRAFEGLARRYGGPRADFLSSAETLTPANAAQRPTDPTSDGAPLPVAPVFDPVPPEAQRPASWSRAPHAVALPSRWTVLLQRSGADDRIAHGASIPGTLAVGPDPETAPPPAPDDLGVDEAMCWMVDFDAAVAVGMALRIPIAADDLASGFDRVLVFGLRASDGVLAGPAVVADLLAAHRFTDGFDIVPQGSPTNNTARASAAFTRSDPGHARAHGAVSQTEPAADRDGPVLERFLGLDAGTLAAAEHASQADQISSRHMLTALWSGTAGYFLAQMLRGVAPASATEAAREWVLSRLRPRGPLPAIRVGETPYGIVPVGAIGGLAHKRAGVVAREIADLVGRLWPHWRAGSQSVPHVTRDGDPDDELMAILGMEASARHYRVRYALGEEFTWHAQSWLNIGRGREPLMHQPGRAALTGLGHADWDPRLVHLALAARDRGVPYSIVDEAPVSDDRRLADIALPDGGTGNYISWLARAPLAHIRADTEHFPGGTPPSTLLYKVLRHCVLLEWGRLALQVLVDAQLADAAVLRERELVGFAAATRTGKASPTVWEALDHPAPGEADPAVKVSDRIAGELKIRSPLVRPLHDIVTSLDHLAGCSTAELERLFTETLDTFSHRLDPWITALLVDAINARREARSAVDYHLGAFGWVEDLRAKPLPPPLIDGPLHHKIERVDARRRELHPDAKPPRPAREPARDNAGFVHAPSLAQATVGAILRNGHLTHRDPSDGQRLAIDLSSARVRRALELLDGVRAGQPLGALLGYRFERGLHRLHRDVLVKPLRDRFPLYANRLTLPAAPTEAVAANNVVNGLDLHRAWRAGDLFDGNPPMDGAQRSDVETLLRDLDDVLDAIADLSISESVFQLARGNPTAAGGLLDAISRGERPSEPEVVRTPRGGIDLTNRLLLLLAPGAGRSPRWGGINHPRSVAEPRLDAWISNVLPDPSSVRCTVSFIQGGAPQPPGDVTLAQLELAPLDAIELAGAAEQPAQSELEQRVLLHARQLHPNGGNFAISFARDASFGIDAYSFPEFLELAGAARELLAGARPLTPQDLLATDRDAAAEGGTIHLNELSGRADGAIARLGADLAALEAATTADALRAALLAASLFGVQGAIPVEPVASDATALAALARQRGAVVRELTRRHESALGADAAFDRASAREDTLRDHLIGLLRTVFGRGFTALPTFMVPAASELATALDDPGLLDGDPDAPERWIAQVVPVRAGVWRFDALRILSMIITGRDLSSLHVAQLPYTGGERWLARPFDPAAPPAPGHRTSLVAAVAGTFDASSAQSGLMFDEWVERIPVEVQSTGLAFHYDQPTSRAPQALLFAVCPDGTARWDDEALATVLSDALDLVRARGVDLETLPGLGQLLPTLFFPFNAGGETVSLDYAPIE